MTMKTLEASALARLLDALDFAALKHRDQRRKGAEASPYINHPISLATLLASTGEVTDVEVLQAAILHDTIEDTKTTREEIVARFGERVASIVCEVTDDKTVDKARRKALQIEHAPHMSAGATLVKLADKTCNLRDMASAPPQGWSVERRREYFDWARKVVGALPASNAALREAFYAAANQQP